MFPVLNYPCFALLENTQIPYFPCATTIRSFPVHKNCEDKNAFQ